MVALIVVYGTFALLSLIGMIGNEKPASHWTEADLERIAALRKPFWRLLHTAHFALFVVAMIMIAGQV